MDDQIVKMAEVASPRHRLVNRTLNPLLAGLPDWVTGFRPQQVDAVMQIMAAFEDVDVVVLDAPTGTGKTLIAEAVRLLLADRQTEAGVRAWRDGMYVCSSKSLQDQFAQ